jgi:hypothetical protein
MKEFHADNFYPISATDPNNKKNKKKKRNID